MAITIDDFDKIWASTSPLTPYSFGESNYKEGWNFIGSTPPARQMWDSIQNKNDEKTKFLLDKFREYLPLAGGTMTGGIEYKGTNNEPFFFGSYGDGATFGWDFNSATGSGIGLYNVSRSTDKGAFIVWAKDGSNSADLKGKPNGDLTWDGKRIAVQGGLVNGHGILSGNKGGISVSANGYATGTVSFGQTFDSSPIVVTCISSGHAHIHAGVSNVTTTGFNYIVSSEGTSQTVSINWIAIG